MNTKILNQLKMCDCYNLFIIILLLFNTGVVSSVRLLELSVPTVADLQEEEVTLDCRYDMGTEELYSVKWYKDEEEFFRYIPRGNEIRAFPVRGVNVIMPGGRVPPCDSRHCPVTLTNLNRSTEGSYRCEVSTEAPTFRLFFDSANMSIVAMPRGLVSISTPRREFSDGEEIWFNCTSPPSDPPPKVLWYANDKLLEPGSIISQSDSSPDDRGLITRSLAAHIIASRELFVKHSGLLELRCEVHAPSQTPLHATVYMSLAEVREQKFDWLSSKGATVAATVSSIIFSICTAIIW